MTFDSAQFVDTCRTAAADSDPVGCMAEVVAAAIASGSSIDDALGTDVTTMEPLTLFSSPALTVQRILWPSGAMSSIHEHRMWAVVGVYYGCEVNRIYRSTPTGLVELPGHDVHQGDVFVLDADAVHSAGNPSRKWTAGLHVYGGDLPGVARRAWDPGGNEARAVVAATWKGARP